MNNPYLNGTNVNENASPISPHIPQTIDSDQNTHQPSPSTTTRKNEKHVLYLDDYTTEEDDHLPSYINTQNQAEASHSSNASVRQFPPAAASSEDIPLDPYYAHSSSEPETAPLMEPDSDRHTPPTAPSIDQIHHPFDKYKRVRQFSGTKFVLAFAVFVVCAILMVTAIATIKCYFSGGGCENDAECKICETTIEKGIQAAGFSFFILISLCIIWRFVKYAVI